MSVIISILVKGTVKEKYRTKLFEEEIVKKGNWSAIEDFKGISECYCPSVVITGQLTYTKDNWQATETIFNKDTGYWQFASGFNSICKDDIIDEFLNETVLIIFEHLDTLQYEIEECERVDLTERTNQLIEKQKDFRESIKEKLEEVQKKGKVQKNG